MADSPARGVRVQTFQWAVGIFCALIGALMLVTPHQFATAAYAAFAPQLPWWGGMFIATGAAMIMVTALGAQRAFVVAAHCAVAVALLMLSIGFIATSSWTGVVAYGLLAASVIAALFVPAGVAARRDMLALVLGASAVLIGCVVLFFPQQFTPAFYAALPFDIIFYGLALILGGGALLVVQLWPVSQPLVWAGHIACVAALWLWLSASGPRLNTGAAYYGGFGLVLAVLPWLGPRLARTDTAALRLRVGLLLAGVALLPLVIALSLVTIQAEGLVLQQTLVLQERLAVTAAHEMGSYVALRQSSITAIANEADLLTLPAGEQHERLRALGKAYPEFVALQTFDAAGNAIARSDDQPLSASAAGAPFFEGARGSNATALETRVGGVLGRPLLIFAAPVRTTAGGFNGVLAGAVDAEQLNQILRDVVGTDALAYAANRQGRVVAASDAERHPFLADVSGAKPLQELGRSEDEGGSLSYTAGGNEQVAGYARTDEQGWGVVVEAPAATALAAVRAGREVAFIVLLLLGVLVVALGALLAQQLTRPLAQLSVAVGQFARGAASAPLPRSGITEVRRLSQAFGAMRAGLAERTAERDEAEGARLTLLDQERAARAAAEAAAGRILRLQAATAAFGNAVTSEQIAAVVTREGVAALGAESGLMALCRDGWMEIVAAVGYPTESVAAWQRFPLDAPVPLAEAVRSGEPVWVESAEQRAARYPALGSARSSVAQALAALPVLVQGETVGAIGVSFHTYRQIAPEDRSLMIALAQQCAQAFERAQLYEAELAARKQAEEAVQLRDAFLSVASHELRTPLTALLGNAHVLQRRVARTGTFTERDQRALEVVSQQGERLNRLLASLLDISRIESGRLSLQPEPFNLAALAQRIVDDLQDTLQRHSVVFQGPPELTITGDALRIEQVLQNLIGNAIKYSPEGGAIEVTLARRDDLALLAVRDEGVGIPADAMPRLFSRFFRAHAADLSSVSGFGIGLYVVNEIVALHGGTVEVASTEGEGSTFTVSLPIGTT